MHFSEAPRAVSPAGLLSMGCPGASGRAAGAHSADAPSTPMQLGGVRREVDLGLGFLPRGTTPFERGSESA